MQEKQKVVLALDLHDDKNCKKKVMKIATSIQGIDSISLDTKEKKLTLTGNMDPMEVVAKLRKTYRTDVVTVGLAKEPEKAKEKEKEPEITPIVNHYTPYNPFCPQYYVFYEY